MNMAGGISEMVLLIWVIQEWLAMSIIGGISQMVYLI